MTCNHLATYRVRMPFNVIIRSILEHYSAHLPPRTHGMAHGRPSPNLLPFHQRLHSCSTSFPDDPERHIPDFIIEVVKLITPTFTVRTVLIVEVNNPQHLQFGISALERQLSPHTAHTKVLWTGTIEGMERRWTTAKIHSHSLTSVTPPMPKPLLMISLVGLVVAL